MRPFTGTYHSSFLQLFAAFCGLLRDAKIEREVKRQWRRTEYIW
ncbi:hypothetical protein GCWU000342_02260 [Shuttleworthella satelles DSM 14600]|uniref:Uncharacterized protein n=1 Tax=Shuttleworthella satelles DSM 14600 TaxID=626523 RepID=C4GDT6_9FIRM|nr:hypothetical protein GCWU000342_02260 [Shuttleworthia satelles DSM 14600]